MKNNNLSKTLSNLCVLFFLIFPAILSNFKAENALFKLSFLPQQIRFLDSIIIFGALFVLIIIFLYKSSLLINKTNFIAALLFLATILSFTLGILFKDIRSSVASFEAMVKFLRPVIIFIIIYNLRNISFKVDYLIKILTFVFVPFLFVAWIQIILFGGLGDDVTGMMRSAHEFANYGILSAIFILPWVKSKFKRYNYFLISFLFIVPILFASYLRAAFFIVIALGISKLISKEKHKSLITIFRGPLIFIILIITSFLFLRIFEEYALKSGTPLTQIAISFFIHDNINYIPIYLKSPAILLSDIKLLFFGFGPGEFGSAASLYSSSFSGDNYMSTHMYDKLMSYYNFNTGGGYSSGAALIFSTTLSVMFMEYGSIFAIILIIFARHIYKNAKNVVYFLPGNYIFSIKVFILFSLLFCVFERIYWESLLFVAPFITIVALMIREASIIKFNKYFN